MRVSGLKFTSPISTHTPTSPRPYRTLTVTAMSTQRFPGTWLTGNIGYLGRGKPPMGGEDTIEAKHLPRKRLDSLLLSTHTDPYPSRFTDGRAEACSEAGSPGSRVLVTWHEPPHPTLWLTQAGSLHIVCLESLCPPGPPASLEGCSGSEAGMG